MTSRRPGTRDDDVGDSTDELPLLDSGLAAPDEDFLSTTDQWAQLPPPAGLEEFERRLAEQEKTLAEHLAALGELQSQLAAQAAQLEAVVARARSDRDRLEARIDRLAAALDAVRAGDAVPALERGDRPPRAAETRAALPKRYLVRLDDASAPLQVLAQERISVGRTPDNDLQLDEDWVSRHHATLRLGPDATIVEDNGSTNGVFVNGKRVRRELLHDGDELAFGHAVFRFQVHRPGGARD